MQAMLQEEKDFPSLHRALAHPCAMDGEQCCGLARADFVLRFESFFAAPNAGLTMAYEVWPVCGDGLDLEVRLTPQSTPKTHADNFTLVTMPASRLPTSCSLSISLAS